MFTYWVKESWILNSCLQRIGEVLTPYGGLVGRAHFLEDCGVISELDENYPLFRANNNVTPVADILKAFVLNSLIGGSRLFHHRRLQDDTAVAKITGMHKGRLCVECAIRRLCAALNPSQVEAWFAPIKQMIHPAIPPNAVAGWTHFDPLIWQARGRRSGR